MCFQVPQTNFFSSLKESLYGIDDHTSDTSSQKECKDDEEKTKPYSPKIAYTKAEESKNKLFKNEEITKTKPELRIIHQMARSGGTIISKCLGTMSDIILLSEIHPKGSQNFDPIYQSYNWFDLFTPEELGYLEEKAEITFKEVISLIYTKCEHVGKILIIRDWNHFDFIGTPFLENPSYQLTTATLLKDDFSIIHTASVRHPIDQWLSMRSLDIMNGKIELSVFLDGYLQFAEQCQKIGFIRYEDFISAPEQQIESLCDRLKINYDPQFINRWWKYDTITGETYSERGDIVKMKPVPRKTMEDGLLEQFEENKDYQKIIKILGYGHPI